MASYCFPAKLWLGTCVMIVFGFGTQINCWQMAIQTFVSISKAALNWVNFYRMCYILYLTSIVITMSILTLHLMSWKSLFMTNFRVAFSGFLLSTKMIFDSGMLLGAEFLVH